MCCTYTQSMPSKQFYFMPRRFWATKVSPSGFILANFKWKTKEIVWVLKADYYTTQKYIENVLGDTEKAVFNKARLQWYNKERWSQN